MSYRDMVALVLTGAVIGLVFAIVGTWVFAVLAEGRER